MEVKAEWSVEDILARLTELEERLSDPPTWKTFEAALNRIEALERGDMLVSQSRDERDRQARWHATRDAYVTGHLARGRAAGDDDLVFHWAKAFADRAHGPLEGEAETWTSDLEKRLRVDALVKAARAAERDLRNALSKLVTYGEDWQSADNLAEALEPFEGVS